jgi:hypothetical protein
MIKMPSSFDEAIVILNQKRLLSEYPTVREWQRSAYVAMMVENRGRGRPRAGKRSARLSIVEFARLRVYGLRSPVTIAAYLSAWQGPTPSPGQVVEIPVADPGLVKDSFRRDK